MSSLLGKLYLLVSDFTLSLSALLSNLASSPHRYTVWQVAFLCPLLYNQETLVTEVTESWTVFGE